MKKIIIPFMLALTSSMANAEYLIKIPLEQAQGGTLPDGSISITSEWVESPTVYGEWFDQSQPYNCTNWSPVESTITMGEEFTQTATDCSQDQTRTAQDQEVETISGIVRDKGEPYTQSRTITVSSTRDSVGTLGPWEQFAQEKGLSKTWNNLLWASKGLSYIPNAPYPITRVGNLYLHVNQLTNVNGLSNLTSANNLYLQINQLTNVDGLSNLTSVSYFSLYNNQLTNVNGLSNLTSVDRLYLNNNQLTNVNGLANVKVSGQIMIDATYSGPKLASNTRFCTENPDEVFPSGYAQKSQLCESP